MRASVFLRRVSASAIVVMWACGGTSSSPPPPGDASMQPDVTVAEDGATIDSAAGLDSSGGGDAGGDAGGFSPSSIAGLALWLEASQKVTVTNGLVASWGDLSGNKNDATQSDPALRPVPQANVVNGHPTVRFLKGATVGRLLVVADAPSLNWGTDDYALWVVARFDNQLNEGTAAHGVLFNKYDTGTSGQPLAPFLITNFSPNTGIITGAGLSQVSFVSPYNDNVFRDYGAHRIGPTLELRVNGFVVAQDTKATVADVSSPGIPLRIGNEIANYRRLNGDIAEMIAVRAPLTSQDLTKVALYLRAKYAL